MKNGEVSKIQGMKNHPINKGALCIKASSAKELLYHPNRLKHPLKRIGKKGEGKFKQITWDEALKSIATKLLTYREKYGPQSVLFYRGYTGGYHSIFLNRLANVFGSPNFISSGSVCALEGWIAEELTYGKKLCCSGLENEKLDGEKPQYVIIWGKNPVITKHPVPELFRTSERNKSKIVVIDPRFTETAQKADRWIPIRPGTDGALALGMMHTIIDDNLYNPTFVKEWTIGFEELTKLVSAYAPETVESITGVPTKTIVQLAREYASTKEAVIYTENFHNSNGFYTNRAISCLRAITGHIDVLGSDAWPMKGPINRKNLSLHNLLPLNSAPAIGKYRFEIFCHRFKCGQSMVMAEAILTQKPYPIKAFLEFRGNALMWPNSTLFFKALSQLDFHVVVNLFMTPSARYADIVLPACTFLERVGSFSGTDSYVFLGQPAVQPMFECWPDYKIIFELAKHLNLSQYFWNDINDAISEELEPTNISLQDLKTHPEGILFQPPPMKYQKYQNNGFQTPSGKIEFYSETLEKHGYNPLPIFVEPTETPKSNPKLAQRYPLALITGEKLQMYVHSTLHNIASMQKLCPNPLITINKKDANKRGIQNGDLVIAQSPRGKIELVAKVTENIMRGVVSIPHGWEQANANILTDDSNLDPVSGYPAYRGSLCEVKKL